MNKKKGYGLLAIGCAIALFAASDYIQKEVDAGQEQIESAQKSVDTLDRFSSFNPTTKMIGKGITKGAQKKIDAGSDEAAFYQSLADLLRTLSVLLGIGGALLFVFGFFRRSS